MIERIVTIGVYGFDENAFFEAIRTADIDTFCDIRQRRGLRGRQYAFANSKRLQARLAHLGVKYVHIKELAPTEGVRNAQKQHDKEHGVLKRDRTKLGDAFIGAYKEEVLSKVDCDDIIGAIPASAKIVAFFCVERNPEACHRHLVSDKIGESLDLPVTHVHP